MCAMNVLSWVSGSKRYEGSLGKFSFQYKMTVRKTLRASSDKSVTFGNILTFDVDFAVPNDYDGPRFEGVSDISELLVAEVERFFARDGKLHRKYIYRVLQMAEHFFKTKSPTLVDVRLPKDAKINVCGDIHGQYYDLLKILTVGGAPSTTNLYLFNGDIVDKGPKSTECMILLFLLKLQYPNYVFINRGNHECSLINATNGFAKELKDKYDDFFMFEFFGEIFKWLPLAHVISGRILVVHGGLSSNLDLKLQDIAAIKRPVEPHRHALAGELLWSDPSTNFGVTPSTRGIGVQFGPEVTKKFLEQNDLLWLIRSHSQIREGFGKSHEGCYTVYSAPCASKGVLAGIFIVEGKHLEKQGCKFPECTLEEICNFKARAQSVLMRTTSDMGDADTSIGGPKDDTGDEEKQLLIEYV